MPGIFALGYPCWYPLAMDAIAIGAATSSACHHGAMGSMRGPSTSCTPTGDIATSSSGRACEAWRDMRHEVRRGPHPASPTHPPTWFPGYGRAALEVSVLVAGCPGAGDVAVAEAV